MITATGNCFYTTTRSSTNIFRAVSPIRFVVKPSIVPPIIPPTNGIVFPKIGTRNFANLKNQNLILDDPQRGLVRFIEQVIELSTHTNKRFGLPQENLVQLRNLMHIWREKFGRQNNTDSETVMTFIRQYNQLIAHHEELESDERTWHSSREHNIRDIAIFCNMQQGTSSATFMRFDSFAYDQFLDEIYPYDRTKHKDTYVKHSWDKPSNTILSHLEKDGLKFIHPEQPRTFTPLEVALIQSFPSNCCFSGGRNAQYRQIGNAVPPLLAQRIGESILRKLDEKKIRPKSDSLIVQKV